MLIKLVQYWVFLNCLRRKSSIIGSVHSFETLWTYLLLNFEESILILKVVSNITIDTVILAPRADVKLACWRMIELTATQQLGQRKREITMTSLNSSSFIPISSWRDRPSPVG